MLDLDEYLPISLVRSHCKCDDTPNITDDQLRLYREVAFEQAELFTGKVWSGTKDIVEKVSRPQLDLIRRRSGRVRIHNIPVDGIVRLIGAGYNVIFTLEPGTTAINLSSRDNNWGQGGGSSCCNSCSSSNGDAWGAILEFPSWTYTTGVKCAKDIPAGIKLGCLQFIAWAMENPGDIVDESSVKASGARAQWSNYKRSIAF